MTEPLQPRDVVLIDASHATSPGCMGWVIDPDCPAFGARRVVVLVAFPKSFDKERRPTLNVPCRPEQLTRVGRMPGEKGAAS